MLAVVILHLLYTLGELLQWLCLCWLTDFIIISPPENDSFRKDFCFTHDVFFVNRQISEMRVPTGLKFCTMVSTCLLYTSDAADE